METLMQVPQGTYEIRRLPYRKNDTLRAWDAADEYLLNRLSTSVIDHNATVLILNDSFGALSVALNSLHPLAITDSFLSQQATRINLDINGIDQERVTSLNSLQLPESVWKILERLLGSTTTSLARKKARLIQAAVTVQRVVPENPYPIKYRLENTDFTICNHANVFSRNSLDIGTRFLLQYLPVNPVYQDMIDLGCGNGVVGLMFANKYPQANIRFFDESFMAIASAQENFEQVFGKRRQAQYFTGDCLTGVEENSADCIVCNPPFHQQHAVANHIAFKMFKQSLKVLKKGGELRVIGNRHLKYHLSLKQLFGCCNVIASNSKFVIFKCVK